MPVIIYTPEKPAEPPVAFPRYPIGLPTLSRKIHGRDVELAKLRGALLAKGEAAIVPGAVVQGQGGLGKSTLARFYAERFKEEYYGILWVAAENGPAQGICAAGAAVGVPAAVGAEGAKAVLAAMMASRLPWLVVYDNLGAPQDLDGYVPQGGNVHLIVTARQSYGWHGYDMIQAGMLDFATENGAAVTVLMEAAGREDAAAEARALAEDLGGLPLALVVAGALIKESREGFAAYRGRLADIIHGAPVAGYPTTVFGAVKLSYDRLGADARRVLDLFAWFAPEGLDAWLLTEVPSVECLEPFQEDIGADLLALASDKPRVEIALRDLTRAALLDRAGEGFALHRLTALVVRGLVAEPDRMARAAASVLAAVFPDRPDLSTNWPHCRHLTPHVAALLNTGNAPETEAMESLLNEASVYLNHAGMSDTSLHFLRRGVRLLATRYPETDRKVAIYYRNMASALWRIGDFVQAEVDSLRSVELDAACRPGTEDLAKSLLVYGRVLGKQGRWDEAARVVRRGILIRRKLYGCQNVDVAHALVQLAVVRHRMGLWAAAERLFRAALTIERQLLAPDHANLGYALRKLGALLVDSGRAAEAEVLLEEALDVWRKNHDNPDHPERRAAAGWLITCLLTRAAAGENAGLREARAKVLCATYRFELADIQAQVTR